MILTPGIQGDNLSFRVACFFDLLIKDFNQATMHKHCYPRVVTEREEEELKLTLREDHSTSPPLDRVSIKHRGEVMNVRAMRLGSAKAGVMALRIRLCSSATADMRPRPATTSMVFRRNVGYGVSMQSSRPANEVDVPLGRRSSH